MIVREFHGRGALVTGGASGIGLALAEALAARGARVALCDVDPEALAEAEARLRARGAEARAFTINVADRDRWRALAGELEAFGPLHLVCANAGIAPRGSLLSELDPKAWDEIVAVNLTGVFNTCRFLLPLVKAHGEGGHLVLTSSMAGMLAGTPIGDYAVTKFGVSALGEALRAELAPERIGVSILYPGVVATPLVGQSRAFGMDPAAVAERVLRAITANEPFIFTHADYRPLVEARFAAILRGFGASADPNFQEADQVLTMMKNPAIGAVEQSGEAALSPIDRLLAIENIRQLKARYFRCMDTKDWAGLDRVFAADAVFDLREVDSVRDPVTGAVEPPLGGEEVVFRGHAAVLNMIRTAVAPLITVHHGHMGEIDILSHTNARGIWAMEDLIYDAPSVGGRRFHGYGHYHETYVKDAEGWKIHTTRITRLQKTP